MSGQTAADRANIATLAAALVGVRGIEEVVQEIRQSMLSEALTRSQGNRTHAASLLGVTRQAVQQMVGRYDVTKPDAHGVDCGRRAGDGALT
jgi:DNA-binding NtrC family response regulator